MKLNGVVARVRSSGRRRAAVIGLAATLVLAGTAVAAAPASAARKKFSGTVVIGTSLSLTGDFSASGQAFKRGYELWEKDINAHGGLLGKKVVLKILSDASTPNQVATNYNTLISSDHAQLVIGPFSSLLTVPAAKVVHRYGYAFLEGAGGAPSVFDLKLPDVFDVSYPVATGLVPFAKWIAAMPASQRPKTAAYATVTTIFTSSQFPVARKILSQAGVKTVYTKVFPTETTDYTPLADAVAASKAQVMLLGSVEATTVAAFMDDFESAHYNPEAFIATSGPDEGATFLKDVGKTNAVGVMVPNGWYPGVPIASSKAMVKQYLEQYGGTTADVTATTAEAYSVGQVLAEAVKDTNGFTNKKIIKVLHSGKVFETVQGRVKFNSLGENVDATIFTFQWQSGTKFVQILPKNAKGSVNPVFPKPSWS